MEKTTFVSDLAELRLRINDVCEGEREREREWVCVVLKVHIFGNSVQKPLFAND